MGYNQLLTGIVNIIIKPEPTKELPIKYSSHAGYIDCRNYIIETRGNIMLSVFLDMAGQYFTIVLKG